MAYFPTVSTQKKDIKDACYVGKDACSKSYKSRGLGGL
jgi:hypothetical protein